MKMPEHFEIQAFDLYRRITSIHHNPPATPENIPAKYIALYRVLEEACYGQTEGVTLSFANLFARLDYVCRKKHMTPADKYAIQVMRRNGHLAMGTAFQGDMESYLFDLRALARFISLAFGEEIPTTLLAEIPAQNRPYHADRQQRIPYIRAIVSSWDKTHLFATTDRDEDPFIVVNYAQGGYQGDLAYLHGLLRENLPLNLLDVQVDENHEYIPSQVILYPDYLIDISALAACFREYGHHPDNFFINKIKPKANTYHILLGNLAGQFLDDYVNEQEDAPVTYAGTMKKFFASSALEFCTCEIPDDFHKLAQAQMKNIRSFIRDIMPRNLPAFDPHNTLLEASFICEKLGLQGRVDMLQKDFKVLVEQKSGKRDEYRNGHKEDHFVQMMLYQGILMYNFGLKTEDLQSLLLYSKYADGLMLERFTEPLFRESIGLRNRIAAEEMALGEGSIARLAGQLDTHALNEKGVQGKLWNMYQKPELEQVIRMLKQGTPLEQAYFRRFFTFVSKEQILNKTGGTDGFQHGFAGTWHTPLAEKIESGNILLGLSIIGKRQSSPGKGYDLIELALPGQGEDFLPNFRPGDIVIFYPYRGEPDVRHHILMKGNLISIRPERITLQLRNGQQNKDIIGGEGETFAIEHDSSDISTANALRGLYAFLSADAGRKALLLGQRPPARHTECRLNGSYGQFDPLILQEKQCADYFLLVGPPGTGKTSCALRYMIEEELTEPDTSLLLLSYTNRAVDEICAMLTGAGIAERFPFIRMGHEASCDARFTPYLLKNSLADCSKLADIREKIVRTRIFVGTTTALNSRPYLFHLKHFTTAFIDEASQILEPELIGILSARHKTDNAIGRFVLIGDYKQLPAITQQSGQEARVTDPLLVQIGLTDCRNSLFERLYKQSPEEFRSILRKQGRMHPAISDFPNYAFYHRERLEPVPLPHQKEIFPYPQAEPKDNLDRLILQKRMVFITSGMPDDALHSEKSNPCEARIVAALVKRIYRFTCTGFDAHKTVGVIVPYRNQIAMIRKEIARLGIPALADISIDTVERYQGSQRDVIIYSFTVRTPTQLNFLAANTFHEDGAVIDRKLNVAITRARKQLFLTGNPHILGANPTFFKLMEYIRMHNGYIHTDTESFCRGNFPLEDYPAGWDLRSANYPLSVPFARAFDAILFRHTGQDMTVNDTSNRESTAYGKYDYRQSHAGSDTAALYAYYYMRRSYCAARALYETAGNWLFPAIRHTSGRVVFIDLSYENGASALALADACRRLPYIRLNYMGIPPAKESEDITRLFFRSTGYEDIEAGFHPGMEALATEFRTRHAAVPELVLIHVANLFDRISPHEARERAREVGQLMDAFPFHHYAVCFRDDTGERMDNHSYLAFCESLPHILRPLHGHAPIAGCFYYNQGNEKVPPSEAFTYEIRTNRKNHETN